MASASPFDLPPFHDEPFTDFGRPDHAAALRAALARVRGQLGRRHPNAAGARRFELEATLASTHPTRPSEVIGILLQQRSVARDLLA